MESFERQPTATHVPPREERRAPPNPREKLWMAGVVALAVGVGTLLRRRFVRN